MFKRLLILLLCLMTLAPAIAEEPAETITVTFVGDCSIGDSIQYRDYAEGYHAAVAENGYAWPFENVRDILAADDLTVANLEVVFTTKTAVRQQKMMNLIGDPSHVACLTEGSIEVVCTANNHAWDFGSSAYHEMLGYLEEAGIEHFGTLYPTSADGSDVCTVVEVKGVKFGFLGFSYPQDYDRKRITNRIEQLREQGAQVVVASLHWGTEEQAQAHSGQQSLAKYCIEAGADVVYGHHPHVLQSVQFYKGKPIFYSTGNFTFGAMSDVDPDSGIFQLTWNIVDGQPVLSRFDFIAIRSNGDRYRPYLLTDDAEILAVRKKLKHKENAKNFTTVSEFFLQNGYMEFENGVAVGE